MDFDVRYWDGLDGPDGLIYASIQPTSPPVIVRAGTHRMLSWRINNAVRRLHNHTYWRDELAQRKAPNDDTTAGSPAHGG